MASHHSLSVHASRGELERQPRDPFAVNEANALEVLQLRYADLCQVTVRDRTWYAERKGDEVTAATPDDLVQAIFMAWGTW